MRPRQVEDEMDAMWERAMGEFEQMESFMRHMDEGWSTMAASPTLDVHEAPSQYVVCFSMPGLDRSNVVVTLEGRLLTVRSAASDQARSHVSSYSYERRVLLPGPVQDESRIRMALTNDVLRIQIPKAAEEIKPS
jgi:HSP20 family molecular chaperone IbpA